MRTASEKSPSPSLSGSSNERRDTAVSPSSLSNNRFDGKRKLVLIPAPSEYPEDPLNWPRWKRYLTLAIVCFGSYAAASAPIAHQTAYIEIAKTFHRTPTELTYTISAAVAGLLAGPFFLAPLVKVVGRTAIIFWCFLATMAAQIWSAVATGPDDYISFTMSRLFSGIFASIPTVVGSGYIMDVCFLHERGFAFASYELSLLLGLISAPTIGGFIVQSNPWSVVFWWTLGPLALAAGLFALVIRDTEYLPGRSQVFVASSSPNYVVRRMQHLTGRKLIPHVAPRELLRTYAAPFIIGLMPITILAGFYVCVNFGWSILVSTELAIFLQTPEAKGGYGFSPTQTAAFTFTSWVAVFTGQAFGVFYTDRVPIWLSLRRKGSERGHWHPEDRLWAMLIGPASFTPIGLGIIGASLQYHLHYMLLALGWFFTNFSALLCMSVCVNYVVETFTGSAVEVSVAMGGYRQALGLSLSFFFQPWQRAVGVGWLFGMAAFFTVFAMCVVATLAWQGHKLRALAQRSGLVKSEDGQKLAVD